METHTPSRAAALLGVPLFIKRANLVIALGIVLSPSTLSPSLIFGQTPDAVRTFEVATIRPSSPDARGSHLNGHPDGVSVGNMNLDSLIKFAYQLNASSDDQIIGGPKWIHTSTFDIDAKEDPSDTLALSKMSGEDRIHTLDLMLQALLADRFHLKVHHETRLLPVLALVVAPGGPKLTKPADGPGWRGLHNDGQGRIEGRDETIASLVNDLGYLPEIGGRMVVDQTGLTGHYDFTLNWSSQQLAGDASSQDNPNAVGLFAALPEQLGLKLKSTKAPVDVLVIDHIDPPTPN
jgi:uncharacterized protein (TIGR03435 family)